MRLPIYLVDIAQERARIARELHDGIAQDLAAIGYALDSEIGRSDTNPNSRAALRLVRERITTLNATVRGEIFRLRTAHEAEPQRVLEDLLKTLEVDFEISGVLPAGEVGTELCKVLHELTRNALEHAGATAITLVINSELIIFQSNGASSTPIREKRFGLVGASERLTLIGWELTTAADFSQFEIHRLA